MLDIRAQHIAADLQRFVALPERQQARRRVDGGDVRRGYGRWRLGKALTRVPIVMISAVRIPLLFAAAHAGEHQQQREHERPRLPHPSPCTTSTEK